MNASTLYLLDTNVISHLMRDAQGTVAQRYRAILQSDSASRMTTSVVVQCELAYGLRKRPSPKLQMAYAIQMEQLPVLPLDETVVSHYAQLRADLEQLGTPMGPNDTLIAAHALAIGATLVSADAEFTRVPGLQVQNWLQTS